VKTRARSSSHHKRPSAIEGSATSMRRMLLTQRHTRGPESAAPIDEI
jgi:hypothetical protein